MSAIPGLDYFESVYSLKWEGDVIYTVKRIHDGVDKDLRPCFRWIWMISINGVVLESSSDHDDGYNWIDWCETCKLNGFNSAEDAWEHMARVMKDPVKYVNAYEVVKDFDRDGEPVSPRDLISVAEAAEILGVTPTRIRALIKDKRLVAYKPKGRWLVDRKSVESRQHNAILDLLKDATA